MEDPAVLKGVHLTLLAGPVILAPMPRELLDALTDVEVTNGIDSPGGFRLTFSLSSRSILHQAFLVAATRTPLMRIVVVVTINSLPKILMNGVLTNQEVSAGETPGQATLTVTGEDLTRLMDLQDWSGLPYPGMGVIAQVNAILAKYLAFGVVPFVIPPPNIEIKNPVSHWEAHQGTDLCHIQRLAADAGYVFYVEPGAIPATTTAYFGPESKIGIPQPALNLDLDAHRNVESMSFSFDSASTDLPIVMIQNPLTRLAVPIPIPKINPLQPPLGVFGPPVTKVSILKDTAKDSVPRALGKGLARAACSQNAVSATGSLDVARYGRLLTPRGLVGVRGAGVAFDGLYFVESVTTTMQAGQLKQAFRLSRNGLVSITPVVAA
jgi:hypothetical protein